MYLYHCPDGDVSEQSVDSIVLRILEDITADHRIQVNAEATKPWQEVEAIAKAVEKLQSGYEECEYVGPDVVGTLTKDEVVARIAEKTTAPHLVRDLSVLHGEISQWTSWKDIWELHQEVAKQKPGALPTFVRKKHAFVPRTRIYFEKKRIQYAYVSREKALSVFAAKTQEEGKEHFDPTRIRRICNR